MSRKPSDGVGQTQAAIGIGPSDPSAALEQLDFLSEPMDGAAMSDEAETFDVIIAGGGLTGLPLALALAKGGFEVAVVDTLDPAVDVDPAFDGRVSSIADASLRMLQELGIAQHLDDQLQPINDIVVTDGRPGETAAPFFLHFDHKEIGETPLGAMVENRHLRVALRKALATASGITLLAPERIVSFDVAPSHVSVVLGNGDVLQGALLVGADGRGSQIREQAGIQTVGWSYGQSGIVTTVEHELPHDGVAQEYFLPSGPFAVLPMVGNRASLVWTEQTDLADALLGLDDSGFAEECSKRFGPYLGDMKPVGPRWSYPLSLQLARDYVRPRIALAGDAAHGIHPLAGQGLNLGLRDVAALADVLVDAKRVGLDIGALVTLHRYERWRRFDNVSLAVACDGLNRLFSNDVAPLRLLRDVGLGLVNRIGPARRFFMRLAGGGVGDLPRLMRGDPL
jgi:2-octaprenyl-6-methoxyphenol hydroxylase